jgi:pimeloyl-ACP methyl ester carboxylesterase
VLLHGVGFTEGAECWTGTLEALADRHTVVAADMLGWGDGDRLDASYSFAYLVDFVRELQDALSLRSSHVVGHSMGGWVASLLAYESPDRVDRLVLVASGGARARPLTTMTRFEPPASEEEIYAELVGRRGLPEGAATRAVAAHQWRRVTSAHLTGYRRILDHMTDPVHRPRYATTRRLPHLRCPTLVVWGAHDDVNDPEMGRETAHLVPDSRLVWLECGHFPPTQAPDAFHGAVSGFLAG